MIAEKRNTANLTSLERAAVMNGRVDYSDPLSGLPLKDTAVISDYYAANKGETFPDWVEWRVNRGLLSIAVWDPKRGSLL